jgi:hypothetical protein
MADWLLGYKAFFPLIGSGITVFGAGLIAYFATWNLNRSMKQTEFFLKFTERFHEVMKGKHDLELRSEEKDENGELKLSDRTVHKEATEIYRQMFSLMSDEFVAYTRGFLARDAFSEWMRWRNYEYHKCQTGMADFAIGNIGYSDRWRAHCRLPAARPEFVTFLDQIHQIPPDPPGLLDERIRTVVLRFSTFSQRMGALFSRCAKFWVWWFIAFLIIGVTIYRIFV